MDNNGYVIAADEEKKATTGLFFGAVHPDVMRWVMYFLISCYEVGNIYLRVVDCFVEIRLWKNI